MFSRQSLKQASRGAALILALALTGAASDALAKGGDTTSSPTQSILPEPLQAYQGNGCLVSEWFDPITVSPTALMPFRAPSGS